MASYGMLLAFSNFQYDRNNGVLGFAPKIKGDFSSFWALGDVWGTFENHSARFILRVLHGEFDLKELKLDSAISAMKLNGKKVKLPIKIKCGDILEILK